MSLSTLQDVTTEKDRGNGFRSIFFTYETPDDRCMVSITVARTVNLALYDEDAVFRPLPGSIESNVSLAAHLAAIMRALLEHPHGDSLPAGHHLVTPALSAGEPAPFTPPCCE